MATTPLKPQTPQPQNLDEIEELTLSVFGNNLNPVMLTYEFLTSSGIVPRNWELAKQPVLNQRVSQIAFQNGLGLVAQAGVVNLVEGLNGKNLKELNGPQVLLQYIEKLPHAEYQKLTISPKAIIPFQEGGPDAARKFITEVLLAPGSWQDFGKSPLQAGLNLSYQLEKCLFNLGINEARIQLPDQTALPALLFAGNFNYSLPEDSDQERVNLLKEQIGYWEEDLRVFREVVHEKFLQRAQKTETSLFPST